MDDLRAVNISWDEAEVAAADQSRRRTLVAHVPNVYMYK